MKNYNHETKDDRSHVSTQAVIDEKFAKLKESKKNREGGSREGGGTNRMIERWFLVILKCQIGKMQL